MIKTMQRNIARAKQQVRQVFLGIVARSAAKSLQLVGLEDEVLQDVEIIQHVGFASWIPEGAKVVIVPVGGKTGRSIVVGSTAASVVVVVSEGETCIYDQFGHTFWLKEDGAHLSCDLFVDGKIVSTDEVIDKKGSMQDMREAYNTHKHGNTPIPDQQM